MALRINLSAVVRATDADYIALEQTGPDASGVLVLEAGAATVGGSMVTLTSAGFASSSNFTVTGTAPGNTHPLSITVAGPASNTVNVGYFETVTEVSYVTTFGNAVSVGIGNSSSSPMYVLDVRANPTTLGLQGIKNTVTNYTLQGTMSPVFGTQPDFTVDVNTFLWENVTNWAAQTSNRNALINMPFSAIRLLATGGGTATLQGYLAADHV